MLLFLLYFMFLIQSVAATHNKDVIDVILEERTNRTGLTIVLVDRACCLSSFRLPTVTIQLSVAVWP